MSSDNRLTTELRRQGRGDAFRMKNITVFTIVITALMSAPTGVSSPSRNVIAAFPISTCG